MMDHQEPAPEGQEPDAQEPELSRRQRGAFRVAQRAAREVLRRRMRVLHLVRDAYSTLFSHENALAQVKDDLRVLLRLAQAWARREYRRVPWRALLYSIAALIYFVNPIDVIPDALVGIGFVDDVAVIGAVVAAIRNDLDDFLNWEQQHDVEDEPDGEASAAA